MNFGATARLFWPYAANIICSPVWYSTASVNTHTPSALHRVVFDFAGLERLVLRGRSRAERGDHLFAVILHPLGQKRFRLCADGRAQGLDSVLAEIRSLVHPHEPEARETDARAIEHVFERGKGWGLNISLDAPYRGGAFEACFCDSAKCLHGCTHVEFIPEVTPGLISDERSTRAVSARMEPCVGASL
jgi:hypothetical protein